MAWNDKAEENIAELAAASNDDSEEVTALHDFIAGGLAGSASVVVGHPFDTIKVSLGLRVVTTTEEK